MCLICRLASTVVIWLGLEADNSDVAMDLILTLLDFYKSGMDKLPGT